MFQVEVYTQAKVYTYRNGGIIPKYDEYAIKQAEKDGRFKLIDKEEHVFTAYGSSRLEAMNAVQRLADYYNIKTYRIEFIDY